MRRFLDLLRDPLFDDMDVDGVGRLELHQKMLEKYGCRAIYSQNYSA